MPALEAAAKASPGRRKLSPVPRRLSSAAPNRATSSTHDEIFEQTMETSKEAMKEQSGFLEVITPPSESRVNQIIDLLLVVIVIHYLLWPFALWPILSWLSVAVGEAAGSRTTGNVFLGSVIVLYLISFFDGSERTAFGRPWHALRHASFWQAGHRYVGLHLIRTAELEQGKQYVMGWHPHGIIILSRLAMYGRAFETLFPHLDVRTLGASPIFKWPGSREISLAMGAVDAGRKTAEKVLKAGFSLIVYPGGSDEIFHTDPTSSETVLELSRRRGFIQLAISHGAPLVPVVVYNERDAYSRVKPPAWLQRFCLKRLRLPLILFYGRWCTLTPKRCKLGVVFGAPIEVPHLAHVTKDDPAVAEVAARYQKALVELWESHKAKFGYAPDEKLVIK